MFLAPTPFVRVAMLVYSVECVLAHNVHEPKGLCMGVDALVSQVGADFFDRGENVCLDAYYGRVNPRLCGGVHAFVNDAAFKFLRQEHQRLACFGIPGMEEYRRVQCIEDNLARGELDARNVDSTEVLKGGVEDCAHFFPEVLRVVWAVMKKMFHRFNLSASVAIRSRRHA